MIRIEITEQFNDVSDEEIELAESRAMSVDLNLKWRRAAYWLEDIFSVKERTKGTCIVQFYGDGGYVVAKAAFDDIEKTIMDLQTQQWMAECGVEEEGATEEDLIIDKKEE